MNIKWEDTALRKHRDGLEKADGRRSVRPCALALAAFLAFAFWFSVPPARAGENSGSPLQITEVMSKNTSALEAGRGDYPDWIEITNVSGAPLDVAGYTVSDGEDRLLPFTFPHTTLQPGEIVLIFASGDLKTVAGYEYHAPFRLSAKGETVMIKNAGGDVVDKVDVPALEPNQSYAKDPATGNWTATLRYTPGLANTQANHQMFAQSRGSASGALVLSEVMPNNVSYARLPDGNAYDYIEIENRGDSDVNLSGYSLSDDENRPGKWVFPDTVLAAGARVLVYASGLAGGAQGELHAGFGLSSKGESAALSDPSGRVIDKITFGATDADRALSRKPGTDEWTGDLPPTPGQPNTFEGAAVIERALRAQNSLGVLINEAMASGRKPNTRKAVEDWAELYNPTGVAVDLSGCGLSDDPSQPRKWQFPKGATIPAGGYLGVVLNGADKANVEKSNYQTNFKLSFTRGETLTLCTPEGAIVDRMPVLGQRAAVSFGRMAGADGFYYLAEPTKGAENTGASYTAVAGDVTFSTPGGFKDGPVTVALSADPGLSIRYTLDASEPSEASPLYDQPLGVSENTVVRARAYAPGMLPSLTATATYLFGEKHTLPVMSVVTDPSYLYDEQIGIYTIGANKNLKYPYKGANFWKDWERAGNIEYFSVNGTTVLSQGAGIALQGQYSRMEDQKAFKITARNAYGASRFDAALFPNRKYESYRSFLLRASGQDYNKTRMRDAVLTTLADQTPVMFQDAVPVIVYLNGEYWGHYNMRERIHKYSIAQWEGWQDVDKISIVKANDNVLQGRNEDYATFLKWLKKNGCKTEENLARVAQTVDIDNYLDYVAVEMYIGNTDLLNVKRYRSDEGDGKWRWVLFDTDWAFYTDTDSYRRWLDPAGAGSGKKTDNTLFVQLMKNPDIKRKFLARFGELMHKSWRSDLVLAKIDAFYAVLEPEMQRHFRKWGGSVKTWTARVKTFRDYARERPKKMLTYIKKELGISTEEMRTYFGDIMNDLGM